ncbi:hypothetical protein KBZ21_43540, partial [Streptomyces sp. A73]|nr:hypothetical protein [Streptomyces sp. A73]
QAGPWLDARRRAGVDDLQRSNEELRDEEIEDFFGALVGREDCWASPGGKPRRSSRRPSPV